MDWMETNGSEQGKWEDRPTPQYFSQGSEKGVALELMVELSNEINAAPWFCIPHKADDEYVREFAKIVKAQLKPNLKVYIEYSNELWNGSFPQGKWIAEKGLELGLDTEERYQQRQISYQVKRSIEIFKIFEEEFGGTSQLVRVMASHNANDWRTGQLLNRYDAPLYVDAVAIAPYFGTAIGQQLVDIGEGKATVNDVIRLAKTIIDNDILDRVGNHADILRSYNIPLIAYEGGQSFVGVKTFKSLDWLTDLLTNANRHPDMYELYTKMYNAWSYKGGELFVAFNSVTQFNNFGSWGMLEYQTQPIEDAPKYRATLDATLGRLPFIQMAETVDASFD